MNADETRQIVRDTVHETLTAMGLAAHDPEAIIELQKDFAWMRRARVGGEEFGKKVKLTVIGIGITGLCYVAWEGIKAAWRAKVGG